MPDRFLKDWIALAVLLALLLGVYLILSPFLTSLTWAVILALVTWPVYTRVRRLLGYREGLSALIMCIGTLLVVIIPVTLLILSSSREMVQVYRQVLLFLEKGFPVDGHPWAGESIEWLKARLPEDLNIKRVLLERVGLFSQIAIGMGQGLVQNLFKLVVTIFILFFVYRDGERFLASFRDLLPLPARYREKVLTQIRDLTRSIFYGIFFTAIAQGIAGGVGYYLAGFKTPIFMGMLTAIFAFVPYGATVVWVSAALWLFINGLFLKGAFLSVWGMGVISMVDNIVRPIVISSTGKVSLLLVFLGSIGGLMAFGMVGLFVGPVMLSIGLVLLRSFLEARHGEARKEHHLRRRPGRVR